MAYIGNSPANIGSYQEVDTISTFNGSLTSFALTAGSSAISPAKSGQLLVSLNGVMQEPDDTGTNGFKVSGSNIVFSSAPATGSTFWAMFQGNNVDVGTPSAGTVGTTELSASGTASATTFLRGDNSWVAPTDTNTTYSTGSGLSTSGTAFSLDLTSDQSWTGSQRATLIVDNDGSFDMNGGNNFKCTPSGNFTLTFTNITDGQSGFILLVNTGGHTVSAHANSKVDANLLATVTAAGTYLVSYLSDGTNVYLTNSAIYT